MKALYRFVRIDGAKPKRGGKKKIVIYTYPLAKPQKTNGYLITEFSIVCLQ